jgi:hypothetical protein
MKELLTAAARVGGTTHLVAAVTSVLQRGPWYVMKRKLINWVTLLIDILSLLLVS